jgi:hypothetical protein
MNPASCACDKTRVFEHRPLLTNCHIPPIFSGGPMDGGYTLREISPRSGTDILNPLPELLYEGIH